MEFKGNKLYIYTKWISRPHHCGTAYVHEAVELNFLRIYLRLISYKVCLQVVRPNGRSRVLWGVKSVEFHELFHRAEDERNRMRSSILFNLLTIHTLSAEEIFRLDLLITKKDFRLNLKICLHYHFGCSSKYLRKVHVWFNDSFVNKSSHNEDNRFVQILDIKLDPCHLLSKC